MEYNDRYHILFALILTFGILVIVPSAFADTVQVTIFPGSGTSQYCVAVSTCFSPNIVNISAGGTVTWTNNDNIGNTVTSGLPYGSQTGTVFESGMIAPGKTYSFTFQDPGTYKYFDKDVKWMVGEVVVGPAQPSPAVPEFGTVARLVVLISIIGVIAITRTVMKST